MNYVFDTNAVIDFICNSGKFPELFEYDNFFISFISYIEIKVGFKTAQEKYVAGLFLEKSELVLINRSIIDLTIEIRKNHRIKLPDSIIMATAKFKDSILITSDKEILKNADTIYLPVYSPR